MRKRSIIIFIIIFLFALTSCIYIPKALIFGRVGIKDYRIFHNREVQAGNPQPWPISKNYNKRSIPDEFVQSFEKFRTVAYLVVKDDSVLFEKYREGYNDSSVSNAFSATKSIISLLTGMAVDDGYIKSTSAKAGDFIPQFNTGVKSSITIKDLLTMSSGLDWKEEYSTVFSPTTQAYYGMRLEKQIFGLESKETPGINYEYQSCNTQLLAFILRKATGMTVAEYASKRLWIPLGAEHKAIWCLDHRDGIEKAYCCFNSNARDFARIGQLCLNKGIWNGKRIISEKYLEESFQPASYLRDKNGKSVDFYGYHWWMLNYKGMRVNFARGLLGQYIFIIPSKNMVIVRLGKKRSSEFEGQYPLDVFMWIETALQIAK